jgi:MFS transporter, DHA1 family, inner membrane transport protein
MARDRNVSEAAAGALVTVSSVTFAIVAPLAAGQMMRLERRSLLVGAMAALALVNLACAFAPDFSSLAALRFLTGIVMGLTGSVASVAAAELVAPEDRGRAFAAVLGGLTASFILGVPLASLTGAFMGWQGSFGLSAGIGALAATVLALGLPRLPGAAPSSGQISAALRDGTILGLYATIFAAFAATFAVVAFLGPLITATTGLGAVGIGAMQSFIGLGSILGLVLGGRIDPARGLWATCWVMGTITATMLGYIAVMTLPFGLVLTVPLAVVILVGAAALFALVPLTMSRLAARAGPAAPVVLALNGSIIALGQGLGAGLGALSSEAFGLIGLAVAGLAVASAALFGLLLGARQPVRP